MQRALQPRPSADSDELRRATIACARASRFARRPATAYGAGNTMPAPQPPHPPQLRYQESETPDPEALRRVYDDLFEFTLIRLAEPRATHRGHRRAPRTELDSKAALD